MWRRARRATRRRGWRTTGRAGECAIAIAAYGEAPGRPVRPSSRSPIQTAIGSLAAYRARANRRAAAKPIGSPMSVTIAITAATGTSRNAVNPSVDTQKRPL